MGACCSDGIPKGTQTDQMNSKAIDKRLRAAEANQPYEHRIILLGPGTFTYLKKSFFCVHEMSDH